MLKLFKKIFKSRARRDDVKADTYRLLRMNRKLSINRNED